MQFMDLLKEWLRLREMENDRELIRLPENRQKDWLRMYEIEDELNRRARGEL